MGAPGMNPAKPERPSGAGIARVTDHLRPGNAAGACARQTRGAARAATVAIVNYCSA